MQKLIYSFLVLFTISILETGCESKQEIKEISDVHGSVYTHAESKSKSIKLDVEHTVILDKKENTDQKYHQSITYHIDKPTLLDVCHIDHNSPVELNLYKNDNDSTTLNLDKEERLVFSHKDIEGCDTVELQEGEYELEIVNEMPNNIFINNQVKSLNLLQAKAKKADAYQKRAKNCDGENESCMNYISVNVKTNGCDGCTFANFFFGPNENNTVDIDWTKHNFSRVSFYNGAMFNINFNGSNFDGAQFGLACNNTNDCNKESFKPLFGTNLNFSNSNFDNAKFYGVNLSGDFSDAIFTNTKIIDTTHFNYKQEEVKSDIHCSSWYTEEPEDPTPAPARRSIIHYPTNIDYLTCYFRNRFKYSDTNEEKDAIINYLATHKITQDSPHNSNFSDSNLSGMSLIYNVNNLLTFKKAKMNNAIFASVPLLGIDLNDTDLSNVDFSNLSNKDAGKIQLANANLTNANLSGIDFDNSAKFNNTNLSGANLTGVSNYFDELDNATKATMSGVDFSGQRTSEITAAQLQTLADAGATFSESKFNNIIGTLDSGYNPYIKDSKHFSGSTLSGITFDASRNKDNGDFSGATFEDVTFSSISLVDANFSSSVVAKLNISNSNLSGASFEDINSLQINKLVDKGNSTIYCSAFITSSYISSVQSEIDRLGLTSFINQRECSRSCMNYDDYGFNPYHCKDTQISINVKEFETVAGEMSIENSKLYTTDFSEANLESLVISNSEPAIKTNFKNARLDNIYISNTTLDKANLNGANLSSATLTDVIINNMKMKDIDLSNATLQNVIFNNVDLGDADLSEATLIDIKIKDTNISTVDFPTTIIADSNGSIEITEPPNYIKWMKVYYEGSNFSDVVVDKDNNLYGVGASNQNNGIILKFNSDGIVQNTITTNETSQFTDAVLELDGSVIYVINNDGFLGRYTTSNLAKERTGNVGFYLEDIDVRDGDGLYLAGIHNDKSLFQKRNKNNFQGLWNHGDGNDDKNFDDGKNFKTVSASSHGVFVGGYSGDNYLDEMCWAYSDYNGNNYQYAREYNHNIAYLTDSQLIPDSDVNHSYVTAVGFSRLQCKEGVGVLLARFDEINYYAHTCFDDIQGDIQGDPMMTHGDNGNAYVAVNTSSGFFIGMANGGLEVTWTKLIELDDTDINSIVYKDNSIYAVGSRDGNAALILRMDVDGDGNLIE